MSLLKTRKTLFEIYLEEKKFDHLREYVRTSLSVEILSPEDENSIRQLYDNFQKKWRTVNRSKNIFLSKYYTWLNCTIAFGTLATPSTSSVMGRPMKNFEECSVRTKRRKTESIRKSATDSELIYATQMSLRDTGQTVLADILKEISQVGKDSQSSKVDELIACWKKDKVHIEKYSEDEGLALLIRNRLSKRTYCDIQKGGKQRGANIYPSYSQILSAKERCYPAESSIKVTESSAEISLQALLDLTVQRILQSMRQSSTQCEEIQNITMISKWGFDGSGGQAKYKQVFRDGTDSDAQMFLTCLVPLQLIWSDTKK